MAHYLAIDVGSTTVTALAIDVETRAVGGAASAGNAAETTAAEDKRRGRSEWDLERMVGLAVDNAAGLVADTGVVPAAIGVTGQQQGLQLLDGEGRVVGPYISWQDQRANEALADGRSYLEAMAERGGAVPDEGGLPAFAGVGCPLVSGYTAPMLYWLQETGQLPAGVVATTAPEFAVARLTDTRPRTDPTDALGWGVYDVAGHDWSYDLIAALGLPRSLLAEFAPSCTVAGGVTTAMAERLGVRAGTPVSVASGDHQCSFAGSVGDYRHMAAVNVGTGGQTSVFVDALMPRGWLDLRPHIQSGYLLAGGGVVGGRSFRVLRDFFAQASGEIAGVTCDPERVYEQLVTLAAAVPAGAEGVRVDPQFTGSRTAPQARAAFRALTPGTFSAGHMARALFEAMAEPLADAYRTAVALGAGARTQLVGSGNAIKLNPVLRESLEREFGLALALGAHDEEAAIGAALCAAVADGAYDSIAAASAAFAGD